MLGLVQMPLHSCAEPNWWITYGKRAASESVWYSTFSLVRQKRLVKRKVWRLNQALVTHYVHKEKYYVCTYQWFAPRIGSFFFISIVTKGIFSLNFERKYLHKTSFTCLPKCMTMTMWVYMFLLAAIQPKVFQYSKRSKNHVYRQKISPGILY